MARAPFDGIHIRGFYGQSWRAIFRDLHREIEDDHVMNGAAALGFYLTLAIFPAMIFLLNLLPYLPLESVQAEVNAWIGRALPGESAKMLTDTVSGIVDQKREGLLSFGAVLTIWAASAGIDAIMQQLNIAYDVEEGRPFWRARLSAFLLVIGFGVFTLFALSGVVLGDQLRAWLEHHLPWNAGFSVGFEAGRWLLVFAAFSLAFSLLYYFGPDVKQEWRFVTPGSVLAVVLMLAASLAFKVYVHNWGNYNKTYGSLGAVIVLMLWLNILGLVTLVGGEVNALLEHYSPEGKEKGEKVAA